MCVFLLRVLYHMDSIRRYNTQAFINIDRYLSPQDSCHLLYYPRSLHEWTLMLFSMAGWYAVTLGKGCHCRVIQAQRHKRTHNTLPLQRTPVLQALWYRGTWAEKDTKCLCKGLGTNMEPLYRMMFEIVYGQKRTPLEMGPVHRCQCCISQAQVHLLYTYIYITPMCYMLYRRYAMGPWHISYITYNTSIACYICFVMRSLPVSNH